MTEKEKLEIIREIHEVDGCEFCFGTKGGVPGNENLVTIDGTKKVACDYCSSDLDRERNGPPKGIPVPRPGPNAKFVIEPIKGS